jgi:hypothetical protein
MGVRVDLRKEVACISNEQCFYGIFYDFTKITANGQGVKDKHCTRSRARFSPS